MKKIGIPARMFAHLTWWHLQSDMKSWGHMHTWTSGCPGTWGCPQRCPLGPSGVHLGMGPDKWLEGASPPPPAARVPSWTDPRRGHSSRRMRSVGVRPGRPGSRWTSCGGCKPIDMPSGSFHHPVEIHSILVQWKRPSNLNNLMHIKVTKVKAAQYRFIHLVHLTSQKGTKINKMLSNTKHLWAFSHLTHPNNMAHVAITFQI